MIKKKKNGLLTFCFSLFPGAGEMYLGFMKMGVSLMGSFLAVLALAQYLNIGPLVYLVIVIWFYSFFHVHNLAGMSDAEFAQTQDTFLLNLDEFFNKDRKFVNKYRNVIAVVLILLGAVLVWKGIMNICYAYLPEMIARFFRRIGYVIPQVVVGIGIFLAGFYMIKGKKEELNEIIVDVMPEEEKSNEENYEVQKEGSANGTEEDHQDA